MSEVIYLTQKEIDDLYYVEIEKETNVNILEEHKQSHLKSGDWVMACVIDSLIKRL